MRRQPIDSSSIRSLGYDFASSRLEVEFAESGKVYEYHDVPYSVYTELLEAESKGTYFNESIKDLYPFRELEPAEVRWPFDEPEATPVVAARAVLRGQAATRVLRHAEDGAWTFLDASTARPEELTVSTLGELAAIDASLLDLATLPPGGRATRGGAEAPWTIEAGDQKSIGA